MKYYVSISRGLLSIRCDEVYLMDGDYLICEEVFSEKKLRFRLKDRWRTAN